MKTISDTKKNILEKALELVSLYGLESITIGELAKVVNMSKSGLFGHFNSKENLQLEILDYALDEFRHHVILPSIKKKRGITRIRAIIDNWRKWVHETLPGGCPFTVASIEFDSKPGRIKEKTIEIQKLALDLMEKAATIAVEEGEFKEESDCKQFAYEMFANYLAYHHFLRLLEDKSALKRYKAMYSHLINRYLV